MAVHFLSIASLRPGRIRLQRPRRRCYHDPLVLAQCAIEVFSDQVFGNKKCVQRAMTEVDRADPPFFDKASQARDATNSSAAAIATSFESVARSLSVLNNIKH